jgi:hypothetical protein
MKRSFLLYAFIILVLMNVLPIVFIVVSLLNKTDMIK